MGGTGSGFRSDRPTKVAMEDVLKISIQDFLDDDGEIPDGDRAMRLEWHRGHGSYKWCVGSIGWQTRVEPGADHGYVAVTDLELWQQPVVTINAVVILQTHKPFLGGRRWYLTCGHGKADGTTCYGRATDLYLLSSEFACRTCHNLAYRSTQRCHRAERWGLEFDDDEVGEAYRWIRGDVDTK